MIQRKFYIPCNDNGEIIIDKFGFCPEFKKKKENSFSPYCEKHIFEERKTLTINGVNIKLITREEIMVFFIPSDDLLKNEIGVSDISEAPEDGKPIQKIDLKKYGFDIR